MNYADFLAGKRRINLDHGHDVDDGAIHESLFPFQRAITRWALRKGSAAVLADTGLGKTRIQVEWARLTGERALILAPLAVAFQTVNEAAAIGVDVSYARNQSEATDGITITNYERLHLFDPAAFGAVVLDESSILKSFSGTTKKALVASFRDTPYRLACTATPAPNDLEELCNHADFLGVMSPSEMRSTFFIADSRGEFMRYRLKRHARDAFFQWLASWAMAVKRPSDLGFEDGPFVLPGLSIEPHYVDTDYQPDGQLFATGLFGVTEQSRVRRDTMTQRVERAVELIHGRVAACVQPGVGGEEPRQDQGLPRGDEERTQRPSAGAVRSGAGAPGEGGSGGEGTSGGATAGTSSGDVRPDGGRAGDGAGPGLRDLRGDAVDGPDGDPARGPRSSDGPDEGHPLPAVQPGAGSYARRPDQSRVDAGVPDLARERRYGSDDQWVIWCGLNDEQDLIAKLLGDEAVSIDGRTDHDERVRIEAEWRAGDHRILVTKPKVFGHGMNWQHCCRMIFVGLGYSYELYYQALRRCHRFGQTRPVIAHIVLSEPERGVYAAVLDKERQALELSGGLLEGMRDHGRAQLFTGTSKGDSYEPVRPLTLPNWLKESA